MQLDEQSDTAIVSILNQQPGMIGKIHAKINIIRQGFSNMANMAVLPAIQMPGLKIFVN